MKAYALTSYKNEGTMQWVGREVPQPGPRQVQVRVQAAGLNPLDRMIAGGQFKRLLSYRLPQVMGQEFAGVITQVGPGVSQYSVGDAVFGRPAIDRIGTFAEYLVADAADIAPAPRGLAPEEAASLPLVLLTAIQAFTEKARVKPGDKVFIQGGSGGLGSVAVQVAKHLGATVATTVSTPNVEVARRLGADVVVDYRTQRYEDHVRDYDVVLDTLGGEETVRSMGVLRRGGSMVSVVGAPDADFARELGKPFLIPVMWALGAKVQREARKRGIGYRFLFMRASGQQLADATPAIESGEISPLVGSVLPFARLEEALEASAAGKGGPGKIVVTMDGAS